MPKKAFLIMLAVLLFPVHSQEVKIGVFIHVPHVFKSDLTDEPYGPCIDYITEVIRDMGYRPSIRLLPFQRILSNLQSGEIDVSLELLKTKEREGFLLYSEAPTYVMTPSLTILASNSLTAITSIDDIKRYRIGYLQGAKTSDFFKDASTIEFDYVSGDTWIQQNLGKLLAKRIDAALDNNSFSYLYEAKKQGIERKIKTLSLPGEGINYYVVFSKASAIGAELSQKYNGLLKSGRYNEQSMIEKYLSK